MAVLPSWLKSILRTSLVFASSDQSLDGGCVEVRVSVRLKFRVRRSLLVKFRVRARLMDS